MSERAARPVLAPPPRDFARLPLPTRTVLATRLFRVSRHSSGEPHFGRSGGNRFDDPSKVKKRRFGTCYFGLDLETAIAESILHDEMPVRGRFEVAYASFSSRHLVRPKARSSPLVLADMTGAALKTLGGNGALSTVIPYTLPQKWSKAVHDHPQQVDGLLYVSRHLNDRLAVVVFERAKPRLGPVSCTPLPKVPRALEAVGNLRIAFSF